MIQEDIKFDKLKSFINNLNNEKIREYIYKEKEICQCPHCKKNKFIKFGKYNGIQRYKCKNCQKTFSKTTTSLWKYSKSEPEKWFKFVELLLERKTLKRCSEILEISIATAFFWRHKVLHAIVVNMDHKSLNGIVYLNLYADNISYKGSRNLPEIYKKKDWLHKEEVYTAIANTDDDKMEVMVLGGRWELYKKFNETFYNIINKDSYIKPDSKNLTNYIAKIHNDKISINIRRKFKYSITYYNKYVRDNIEVNNKIKNCVIRLRQWLGQFNGVATKYLNNYCNLYKLSFIDKAVNYMQVFNEVILKNSYIRAVDIKNS